MSHTIREARDGGPGGPWGNLYAFDVFSPDPATTQRRIIHLHFQEETCKKCACKFIPASGGSGGLPGVRPALFSQEFAGRRLGLRLPGVRWQEGASDPWGVFLQESDPTQKVVNQVPGIYAA